MDENWADKDANGFWPTCSIAKAIRISGIAVKTRSRKEARSRMMRQANMFLRRKMFAKQAAILATFSPILSDDQIRLRNKAASDLSNREF